MLLAAPSLIGVIATPGIAHAATGVVTTNFAYVANSQNNTVAVVNLSTSSVVDTISGFSQPGAMAASPNGQYVYVANYFGNTVSVISTATNSVVATIAVGGSPSGIAVTPNGQYLYVSNLTGDGSGSSTDPLASSVSVISTTTNSVVSTIGLYDSGPAGLAMSPAGDYVYVANDLSASISIISTATNTVVQTFTNLPAPNSTTFNPVSVGVEPDGKYVYFGEANYGQYIGLLSVSSSGPSSDTFSILGGVYTQQIAGFAFNSTTAVAIQGNFSSSAEYFPWGHTAISPAASVVGLANPSAVAVSPDGSTFYITNANNSTVSVVPASSISSNTNGLVTPPASIQVGYGATLDGIVVVSITKNTNTITVSTSAPTNAVVGATYTPQASATSGDSIVVSLDGTSSGCVVHSGVVSFLTVGTCVLDFTDPGNASYVPATTSQSFSIGKGTPTIGVYTPAPGNAVVGGATYTPQATSTSSDSVTISLDPSSTGCALNSGVVSFTGVGTCVVDFTDPGNTNYVSASTSQSFTVSKGTPVISVSTPAPTNAVVAGATYTPQATSTSSDSVTISLDPSSTGCALNSGVVSFTGVGTCVVDFTDAGNTNYVSASTSQSFTVSKGVPVVTFSTSAPTNATIGGATYTPQATSTSSDSVTISLDPTSTGCALNSGVVSFTGAGTCVVKASDAGNANYQSASSTQSFTVSKGTPVISVSTSAPTSAVVGGATYTPRATASSGDSVTISLDPTSTGCALNSGVVSFTGVGTCVVKASDAGNANYQSASSTQSFTVSAPPMTPTLSPVSDLLSGISASGQAIVTWRAPATSGGVSVLSYEVQESVNHGVTWTSSPLTQITGTKAVIRGLSTTASYEFRVLTTGSQATQSVSAPVVTVALTVHDLSLPLEPFVAFHSSLRLKKGGRADAIRLLEEMDAVGYHTLVITGYAIYSPSSPRHPGLTMSQVEALARSRGEMVARFFDILDAQLHLPRLHLRVEVEVHSGKKGLSNFDLFRRVELRF